MAVVGAVPRAVRQVAADRIANLDTMAWARQDTAVAVHLAEAVATDRIARLDREIQAVVVECSAPVDKADVEDKNPEFAAKVSLQSVSYAPGSLALQYCCLKQLPAFGALVGCPHRLSPRVA